MSKALMMKVGFVVAVVIGFSLFLKYGGKIPVAGGFIDKGAQFAGLK